MSDESFILADEDDIVLLIAGHSDPRMLLRTYNNLKVEDVAKKLD